MKPRRHPVRRAARRLALAAALLPGAAFAAETEPVATIEAQRENLTDLSLEELLGQQVTSAAKKPQRLSETAAAVTVITQEQIARSGARSLSDVLRMVPGFEVSEVQSSATAVSARGFASRFAANILVTVDGAASFGTSLTGIFWDQAIFPLQQIERIEVIRGPGGPLWGNNSVNGVVNIITKQGIDTQGVRGNVKLGTDSLRAESGVGVQLADEAYLHTYVTHNSRSTYARFDGRKYELDAKSSLVGVRFDYGPSPDDTIVALAEYQDGYFEDVFAPYMLQGDTPVRMLDAQKNDAGYEHVLARWTHAFSPSFEVTAQGYVNRLHRSEWSGRAVRNLYDIGIEGRWRASERHELNFGVTGRILRESNVNDLYRTSGTDRWLTGYVQDEVRLIPDKLVLTVGSKFEINNFGNSNVQPSARLLYHVDRKTSVWASVSRAVRTPLLSARIAHFTTGFEVPLPPSGALGFLEGTIVGNPQVRSETLDAFEAGLRGRLGDGWTFDIAAFHNCYRHLNTFDLLQAAPILSASGQTPIGAAILVQIGNGSRAESTGVEAMVAGSPLPGWELEASYAFLDLDQTVTAGPPIALSGPLIDAQLSARHQVRLRNTYTLASGVELSSYVQHVSRAPSGWRDAYTKLDLRATWSATPNVELSLVGLDLLKRRRVELRQSPYNALPQVYVRRSVQFETRFRF